MLYVNYFLLSAVILLSVTVFIKNVNELNLNLNNKKRIILFILILAMTLTHIYFAIVLKLITLIIIYFILNKVIFKFGVAKSIVNTVIIIFVWMLLDIIFSILIMLDINSKIWIYGSYYGFYLIFVPMVLTLLSKQKIIKKFFKNLYMLANINELVKNQKKTLYFLGELIIFILLSMAIYNITLDNSNHISLVLLFLSCSLLTFVFQLLLFRVDSHVSQKNKLNYLNKLYVERIEDDKIYRHNITNKLLSVKAVGNKKVGKLIDDILENENYEIDNAIKFSEVPKTLVVIFYDKLYKNNNINFKFDNHLIPGTLAKLNIITIGKLTESIGIALDNVITASTTVEKPYLLAIFKDNKKYIEISLINNFKDSIDLDKLGDLNYSTKREVSGKGLFSISKAIKYKVKILNDSFNITFQIKK